MTGCWWADARITVGESGRRGKDGRPRTPTPFSTRIARSVGPREKVVLQQDHAAFRDPRYLQKPEGVRAVRILAGNSAGTVRFGRPFPESGTRSSDPCHPFARANSSVPAAIFLRRIADCTSPRTPVRQCPVPCPPETRSVQGHRLVRAVTKSSISLAIAVPTIIPRSTHDHPLQVGRAAIRIHSCRPHFRGAYP